MNPVWYKDKFILSLIVIVGPIGVMMLVILWAMLIALFKEVVLGG